MFVRWQQLKQKKLQIVQIIENKIIEKRKTLPDVAIRASRVQLKHYYYTKIRLFMQHLDSNGALLFLQEVVMLTRELLSQIEKALNIRFEEWHIKYLLKEPQVMKMTWTGRQTGKTTLWILELLFSGNKPLVIIMTDKTDLANRVNDGQIEVRISAEVCDWFSLLVRYERNASIQFYEQFFVKELMDIHKKLKKSGIPVRDVYVIEARNLDIKLKEIQRDMKKKKLNEKCIFRLGKGKSDG